jgi:hypothetical protein
VFSPDDRNDQENEDGMDRTCNAHQLDETLLQNFSRKICEVPKHRWEYNIKMNLKENRVSGCGLDSLQLRIVYRWGLL